MGTKVNVDKGQIEPLESLYGINAHLRDLEFLNRISGAGIQWMRVTFEWRGIEKSDNVFNYDPYLELISKIQQSNVKVFATLAYTPEWAGGGDKNNQLPSKPDYWPRFVSKTVSLFKDSIKYWGMWNEPNMKPTWADTIENFRDQILVPGYEAAKNIDPDCYIVAPDIVCINSGEWWDWISKISKNGGDKSIDIFSCHIYQYKGPEFVIDKLEKGDRWAPPWLRKFLPRTKSVREVMEEAGIGDKPLWLSEVGWYTSLGEHLVSEDKQANYYKDFCRLIQSRKEWLQKVFFYELRDDPYKNIEKWGILHSDGNPKKAYSAYKDFLQNLK